MEIEETLITIGAGVIGTLIATGLIWFFRRQLSQALEALDMSAGGVLAWTMAFIMLAVIITFPLIDVEIPTAIIGVFAVLVGILATGTVWRRRK